MAVLVSDGRMFTSFERGGRACYQGRSCPDNVGRLLPIFLEGEDIVELLLGGAPIIRHDAEEMVWDRRAGAYRLSLHGEGGVTQDIWIAHATGVVHRMVVRDGAREPTLEVVFDDVAEISGHLLPQTLHLRARRDDVDLKLSYRDTELNQALGDDAFSLPCPEGTSLEVLPCEPAPAPAPQVPEPSQVAP